MVADFKGFAGGASVASANEPPPSKPARAPALTDFGLGAQVLAHLGARTVRLLTNNPRRIVGLGGYGIEVIECVPIRPPTSVLQLHDVGGGKGSG
jgi:3,4-dihydroxy 2-butanone 4-phosphate synthase/GTP cyclohydrolase II